jgi:hypothetical protein
LQTRQAAVEETTSAIVLTAEGVALRLLIVPLAAERIGQIARKWPSEFSGLLERYWLICCGVVC